MEEPKYLNVKKISLGPAPNNYQSRLVLVMEDINGNPYYTSFVTRNNYFDGIAKSFSRLRPMEIRPSSATIGTDGKPPDENETMVKHSTGMKE